MSSTLMPIEIPTKNSPDSKFEELWMKCQNRIGRGTTRDVFEILEHEDKVLKVMTRPSSYSNWAEVVVYHAATDKSFFAEVHSWSLSGKFLVMERLYPVTLKEIGGHQTPQFVNDRKLTNFGKDKFGKIKLLDFANLDLAHFPLFQFPASPE
jgi:hypothetical protein